ncbi:ABC transporter permease [bacterium]|nr:ABC transporter permease [bacterium]MDY3022804.1 ABC transporter permease subunit [Oliverpabstia sp.]
MTLVKHELKQGKMSLIVWAASIIFLMVICVLLFPEMKGEMDSVGDMFASMGSFTQAFGMDRISFGSLLGFYAVECGNILGLGGAFFAAFYAVTMIAKEEKDHTAEFLLTHPVSRVRVITEKLAAVMLQITLLNLTVLAASLVSIACIGEEIPWKELLLLHLAYYILQVELSGICFGVSAFLRRGSIGIGLGIATMMYFLNLISNITKEAEFLKYFTPFAYAEGTDIVTDVSLDGGLVALGLACGVLGIAVAYWKYCKKDIQ